MAYKLASELSASDQAYVLHHAIERPTRDAYRTFKALRRHVVTSHWPTDAQWLAATLILVREDGTVDRSDRVRFVSMSSVQRKQQAA